MFTGIIEEIGQIKELIRYSSGIRLTVKAKNILNDIKIGDSISIDGVCQTVVNFTEDEFSVDVSPETLEVTTFGLYKSKDNVNLERALKLSDRLGGHIVSGHVDGVGELMELKKEGLYSIFTFQAPDNVSKYIIYKGSISINGISLTVSNLYNEGKEFSVAVIPHTINMTNLQFIKIGQKVNLESDQVAKYIEKLMNYKDKNTLKQSRITYDFLNEHGFV